MIIYKTTNIVNGKFYIGKDSKNLPTYLGSGTLLKKAIAKYGRDKFIKETIEVCTDLKHLEERERYWIDYYSACELGYNITQGGSGGDTLSNHPEIADIRAKLSANHRRSQSKKTKEKIQAKLTGRTLSEEHKANIAKNHADISGSNNPMYSKKHSEDTKAKQRQRKKELGADVRKAASVKATSVWSAKSKGRTYEEIYGPEKAAELRAKRKDKRKK